IKCSWHIALTAFFVTNANSAVVIGEEAWRPFRLLAQVPFSAVGGPICIPVAIGEKKKLFLIDTGSTFSVVDTATAAEFPAIDGPRAPFAPALKKCRIPALKV